MIYFEMIAEQLQHIIHLGEGISVEFKTSKIRLNKNANLLSDVSGRGGIDGIGQEVYHP